MPLPAERTDGVFLFNLLPRGRRAERDDPTPLGAGEKRARPPARRAHRGPQSRRRGLNTEDAEVFSTEQDPAMGAALQLHLPLLLRPSTARAARKGSVVAGSGGSEAVDELARVHREGT